MAHKVSDACVGCGACEGACPVGAVAVEGGVAVVNADACIDCGACEGACPTGAITAEYFLADSARITHQKQQTCQAGLLLFFLA